MLTIYVEALPRILSTQCNAHAILMYITHKLNALGMVCRITYLTDPV